MPNQPLRAHRENSYQHQQTQTDTARCQLPQEGFALMASPRRDSLSAKKGSHIVGLFPWISQICSRGGHWSHSLCRSQPQPATATADSLEFGNLEIQKSGNLGSTPYQKQNEFANSTFMSPKTSARSGLVDNTSPGPICSHFIIFPWTGQINKCGNLVHFLWWANGPYSLGGGSCAGVICFA